MLDFEGRSQTIIMVSIPNSIKSKSGVQSHMLSYIDDALQQAEKQYRCRVNSDSDWVRYGIARVLHSHDSGREFFQDLRMESLGEMSIKRQDFQEGLKSKRRLDHLTSINENYLLNRSQQSYKQKEGGFHESLDGFHIYAGDGHFHKPSTHENRDEKGKKHAIGHLYSLNLRNRDIRHLTLSSDGKKKKPHDMGALKRMEVESLRQGAKKGQKVLITWDRAIIDFAQWMRWKYNNGIYFITRTKSNMTKEVVGELSFDRGSAENSGVLSDQYIAAGEAIRMITYYDLETDVTYEFITNLPHSIPPGAIVQLYRMRWDIEKVFDDFKNKLNETKAWSKSLTGKRMQAQFMVLAYNLLLRMRHHVEEVEGVEEESIIKKSDARWEQTKKVYQDAEKSVPTWLEKLRRITQISVKFIRWARALFMRQCSWDVSLELLDHEYRLK